MTTIGYGTLVYLDWQGDRTYRGKIKSVTPPNQSRDAIDATHNSVPVSWRYLVSGLTDGGEMTIEFIFDPADDLTSALLAEFGSTNATQERRILGPSNSFWYFNALMTGMQPEAPVDDLMVCSATFKVSGVMRYFDGVHNLDFTQKFNSMYLGARLI